MVLGNLLRGLQSRIVLPVWNLYTKGKENTWLLCQQEPRPSHQHGKLDCSTTQGRLIPKTPASNPLKTPSVSDQCSFLTQRVCHLLSSKPRTLCGCHSSGVALASCPQGDPFELPAAKPTHEQNHLQCLKGRPCSLLLGASTATSNQHSTAKILEGMPVGM